MYMEETFRWNGPGDPVSLRDVRQCGCEGVFTALHHVPYGHVWPLEDIRRRKAELAEYGLRWSAAESVPVSEDIRTRSGEFRQHVDAYRQTVQNLGAEAVEVVIYNFMPVLDWVRTDLKRVLADGSECLHFDSARFAAFDILLLKREGAEDDYTPEQLERAEAFFRTLNAAAREQFERSIINVFPGVDFGFTLQDVRDMLARYEGVGREELASNLRHFLEDVIPACEEAGVRMAVHPDDPPYSILGLPRILSCEADVEALLTMVESPANGLCFCTGSLGVRPDNDLPGMIRRHGDRIHAVHLRSTERSPDGSFHEANHLEGTVDMYEVVRALLEEQTGRKAAGSRDWRLSFRPDHGHTMLDDLDKPDAPNPGYSCIGRMRGLAELRGLELGIARSLGLS